MAVFESGLFSRLSGSFGNVTMYRLGDSNVVKGKRWARDARTPSQLIHRAKWKVLGLLAMRMKKVLELGFPGREARGRVNGFMSRNLPCMACDEGLNVSVDYSKLKVSAGELRAPEVTAQWADSGGILIFKQKRQPLKPLMYDDDRLYVFLWNPEVLRTNLLPLHQRKETAEAYI